MDEDKINQKMESLKKIKSGAWNYNEFYALLGHRGFSQYYDLINPFLDLIKQGKQEDVERLCAGIISISKKSNFKYKYGARRILKERIKFPDGFVGWQEVPGIGLDHPGRISFRDGKTIDFYEPYNLSHDQIKSLIAFCDKKNYACRMTGNSIHFPGWTMRVEVHKLKAKSPTDREGR